METEKANAPSDRTNTVTKTAFPDWAINAPLGLIFLALVFLGINLIIKSEKIFDLLFKLPSPVGAPGANNPNYAVAKELYALALTYFTLAFGVLIGLLLLPRLQSLNISPTGLSFTLKDMQQNINSLIQQNNTFQSTSTGAGGKKPQTVNITENTVTKKSKRTLEQNDNDDPQAGKWGGESKTETRVLSATVKNGSWKGYYNVKIVVESKGDDLLTGIVKFHLHPTFKNSTPVIVARKGKAVLELNDVYGAFTVGAEMDDGKTKLEYDLAKIPGAPKGFIEG